MLSIEDHPSEIQSKVDECHQKWPTATKCCPYTATYITVHHHTWTCPPAGIKLMSQYMCGKSEAGLRGTRAGFNYSDPGPLGKQGDCAGRGGHSFLKCLDHLISKNPCA